MPLAKYEGIKEVRERGTKVGIIPIVNEFFEWRVFRDKLLKLPEKKAEAFILMQNIIEVKKEIDSKK